MSSKHIRADINLAFPTAEIAVMGAEGAVNILYRREIEKAKDAQSQRAQFLGHYQQTFLNPFKAAELGYIDEVIEPRMTRKRLCSALTMLQSKREKNPPRKHDNLPL